MKGAARVCGLAVATLLLAACSTERDQADFFAPEGVDVLVVEAVLIVGQDFPTIRLSRTLAPDVPYTAESAAETGATITIRAPADGQAVGYQDIGIPGLYNPAYYILRVEAETEYELEVITTRGERLTATTRTPAPFAVDSWTLMNSAGTADLRDLRTFAEVGDTSDVYDQPENQLVYAEGLLEARFAAGGAANFAGVGYQLALFSLDLDSDYVIDPPFFEEEDFEDLSRTGSSPALVATDGRARLPWFGIYYEGRYLYKIYTLDLNWYDVVRSTPLAGGGLGFGGNAGDGSDRPIFHVEGGIGLFGSASVDSVGFTILPAP